MADILYPHDYLPMPLQEGYGFQPVSPLKRTQLTTGRARQRRAYSSTPTEVTVSWFMESDVQGPVLVAPIYWRYSATLELWERPLLPPPWGNYPEWIAGSSLLDIALNREWPKHDGA